MSATPVPSSPGATPSQPVPADARLTRSWALAVSVVVTALVGLVYGDALGANFFNDDFHWLADTRRFDPARLVDLSRYDHFYRPVVEIYFYLGQRLVGCQPRPFHGASIAIHLLNTALLYGLARALTGRAVLAAAAALLFCVQPAYVEAVVWVGAITDLLPATWFLVTLWIHHRYLKEGDRRWLFAAFTTFVLCLGTHETAVTILPMMLALDVLVRRPGRHDWPQWLRARVGTYAPFVVALAGFLAVAYVVNRRSYLVRDGYYAFGWHAVTNILDYIAGLYIGRRRVLWHAGVVVVLTVLTWKGSPRVRFYLVWLFVSLLPVSFFTWGGASRYLYVPAAAFALLLAEMVVTIWDFRSGSVPRWIGRTLAAAVLAVLVGRFAMFAETGVDQFVRLSAPYDRFMQAVREGAASVPAGEAISVAAGDVDNIPDLYRDAAAETALCRPGVQVAVQP